jgi:hypothetical protein
MKFDPVPGALFYRVSRSTAHSPEVKLVCNRPHVSTFTDGCLSGDPATYTVMAAGRDGASAASETVSTGGPVAKKKSEED